MAPDFRDAGGDGEDGGPVGGPETALRGGGLPLPGLSIGGSPGDEPDGARPEGGPLKDGYVARVESGRRGCTSSPFR